MVLAWPALLAASALAHLALARWMPATWAASAVVLAAGAALFALERWRPGSAAHRPLDQPLYIDALHFVLDYELGYGLGLAVLEAARRAGLGADLWPSAWPLPAQVAFGLVVGDLLSYWQHRAYHRVPWLWRFHRLHHEGARLNVVRSVRFHWVDLAPATVAAFAPLALLRAPDDATGWVVVLTGVLALSQHVNLALPTPRWLDRVLCTPAVHRWHHSRDPVEGDRDFGTVVTVWDQLFGTWLAPTGPLPREVGVDGDEDRGGFVRQWLGPFAR